MEVQVRLKTFQQVKGLLSNIVRTNAGTRSKLASRTIFDSYKNVYYKYHSATMENIQLKHQIQEVEKEIDELIKKLK